MSERLDLDAILAEFHAEERQKAAAQAPAKQPSRAARTPAPQPEQAPVPAPRHMDPQPTPRRTEPQPAPRYTEPQPAPAAAPVAVAERPAPAPARRDPQPSRQTQEAPLREQNSPSREGRAARRRKAGLIRMALAVAILSVLLIGLLAWVIRSEKQTVAQDPQVLEMDLGDALEDYLAQAPTRMRG